MVFSKARTRSCKFCFTLKFVYKEVTIKYLNWYIVVHVFSHHCINLTKIKEALLKFRIATLKKVFKVNKKDL